MCTRLATIFLAASCIAACASIHGREPDAGSRDARAYTPPPHPDASLPNRAPVAVVEDATVAVGTRVALDGAASFDPEGAPLRFSWTMREAPSGSVARLDAADAEVAFFIADLAGTYEVELEVSDGLLTSTAIARVVALEGPMAGPPIADAGADVEAQVDTAVMLDGSASHSPSGAPLTYAWTITSVPGGSAASLEGADTPTPTLRPDVAGEFVVELVVSTTTASSAPDEVRVRARSPSVFGADVSRGVFDPAEVYLAGTLSEGACYRDAFAHPSDPHAAAVGFDCYFDNREAQLAADGTLVYTNTFEDELREFHCDGCPGWRPGDPYPSDPLANDPRLATPPCDPSSPPDRLQRFELSPDGRRMHTCGFDGPWYDEAGVELLAATTVLDYGWGGHVLLDGEIVDVDTGTRSPVVGLPADCGVMVSRAGVTGGFRVVLECMASTELWSIAHDGTATLEGVYPAPPAGYESGRNENELAADGSLWQLARGPMSFEDAIVVRSVSGRSEVVYTEEMTPEPAVKIHISALVTGP